MEFAIRQGAQVNIDQGEPLYTVIDICIDGMIQNDLPAPPPKALKMLGILLQHGADPELTSKTGKRPIDLIPAYAHDAKSLKRLKSYFRPLMPNIDSLLKQ